MKRIYLVTMTQTIQVTAQDEDEAQVTASELFDHSNTEFEINEPQEGRISEADFEGVSQ